MTTSNPIRLEKIRDHYLKVYWSNNYIGDFVMDDAGFFMWRTMLDSQWWGAHPLRVIADKLDELNKDWADEVARELAKKEF